MARTCREGGPETTGPGFSRTGIGSPTRPVSAVPGARRRVIRKTTTEGVSRFVSQTQPRELTNRRLKPLVTAIHHDQRTNQSSLPVRGLPNCCGLLGASIVMRHLGAVSPLVFQLPG